MTQTTQKIVYFHTGKGGSFNNPGHLSYCGEREIYEVLQINDSGKHNSFLAKENQSAIYTMLKKRNLTNLLAMFDNCVDNFDFSKFESLTGLMLGEDVYTDCRGNIIITVAEVETGVGTLNWDNDHDTDTCMLLSDCGEEELGLMLRSREWNRDNTIITFFDECTDLSVSWAKFNGDFAGLIAEYFTFSSVDINEYYSEESAPNI